MLTHVLKIAILWISTNKGDLRVGRQRWSVWVGLRIPLILVKFITHARSQFFVTFPVIPKIISRVFQNVGISFLVVLIHHMKRKFINPQRELRKLFPMGSNWQSFHFICDWWTKIDYLNFETELLLFENLKNLYRQGGWIGGWLGGWVVIKVSFNFLNFPVC